MSERKSRVRVLDVILVVGVPLVVLMFLGMSGEFRGAYCERCGLIRQQGWAGPTLLGSPGIIPFRRHEDSGFSALYRRLGGPPCRHQWVWNRGGTLSGQAFLFSGERSSGGPSLSLDARQRPSLERLEDLSDRSRALMVLGNLRQAATLHLYDRHLALGLRALDALPAHPTPAQQDAWWAKHQAFFTAPLEPDP